MGLLQCRARRVGALAVRMGLLQWGVRDGRGGAGLDGVGCSDARSGDARGGPGSDGGRCDYARAGLGALTMCSNAHAGLGRSLTVARFVSMRLGYYETSDRRYRSTSTKNASRRAFTSSTLFDDQS